ncbi:MAG: hypothetical protein HW416_2935 [Chloroflexi bacterium]|nr:hypothetical protein [Chloroflexota bacterium]
MFKVKGVRSWNTNAPKLGEMVDFYQNVIGAEMVQHPRSETRQGGVTVTIARLDIGSMSVGFFDWGEAARADWPHHAYDVEWPGDAEQARRQLEEAGVKIEGLRMHGDGLGYSITLRDPCGNRLELSADPE